MSVRACGRWCATRPAARGPSALRAPVRCGWVGLCLWGMACWACTVWMAGAAQAQVWARVDERGAAHFSAEKTDDRYELFYTGGTGRSAAGQDPVPTAALPQDQQDPWRAEQSGWETPALVGTAWPDTGAVVAPGHVLAFFDISPAYKAVRHHIREAAQAHGLDAPLLQAVIAAESGFDAQAISPRGAVGLMQIMPVTALAHGVQPRAGRSVAALLADPRTNIHTGARVLARLMVQFSGQLELVLAAYNAGEGAVRRAGMQVPDYPETRRYVRTVTQLYEFLQPPASLRPARAAASVSAFLRVPMPAPANGRVRGHSVERSSPYFLPTAARPY